MSLPSSKGYFKKQTVEAWGHVFNNVEWLLIAINNLLWEKGDILPELHLVNKLFIEFCWE